MQGYNVTTPATNQLSLISVNDMKAHLEIKAAQTRWDGMLETIIKAAIGMGERIMNRQILKAGITFTFDSMARYVRLPGGRVTEFTSLKYYDVDNTLQELTSYHIDKVKIPSVLFLADDVSVSTASRPDAWEAKYTAGWDVDDVPTDVIQALKMTAAHFFENREEVLVGRRVEQIPFAAEQIYKNHRIPNA